MKIADIKNLKPGDRVYWNDPDEGRCSGIITIKEITIKNDRHIVIEKNDGGVVECFPHELSRPPAHMR